MKLIRVLIEQTGVETIVSPAYYEKYQNEGVRFLEEVEVAGKEKDPLDSISYTKLKGMCDERGLVYKGNASTKELKELLRSN
jgi:hypothetical protein